MSTTMSKTALRAWSWDAGVAQVFGNYLSEDNLKLAFPQFGNGKRRYKL